MSDKQSPYTGHRERLKTRYLKEGLDNFDQIQVLELLLFYCIPKQDTNGLAHRLLDEFGSLKGVLEAKFEDLKKVKGMGEHSALFLSMMPDLCRYYSVKCVNEMKVLNTVHDCEKYLAQYFIGKDKEMVYLLTLDAKSRVINCTKLAEGDLNATYVPIRRVVEIALHDNASSVVLAHNHPGGVAVPSVDDAKSTEMIAEALAKISVQLADHIVIAGNDTVSLLQAELYHPKKIY